MIFQRPKYQCQCSIYFDWLRYLLHSLTRFRELIG